MSYGSKADALKRAEASRYGAEHYKRTVKDHRANVASAFAMADDVKRRVEGFAEIVEEQERHSIAMAEAYERVARGAPAFPKGG